MITIWSVIPDAIWNEYIIQKLLGKGWFWRVFLVTDKDWNELALKIVDSMWINNSMLENELEKALQINNLNVIKYKSIGEIEDEQFQYIFMEYAPGWTLQDIINSHKEQSLYPTASEAINYFKQIVNWMNAINEKVIHRDIKPENILISEWVLKISDFWLAKAIDEATRTNTYKWYGSIPYMAPEAFVWNPNTKLMDIYSVWMVFYQILALQDPFWLDGVSDMELWKRAHISKSAKQLLSIRSDIPPQIGQIIMKMIHKDPSKRYQSWEQINSAFDTGDTKEVPHSEFIDKILIAKDSADSKEQALLTEKNNKKIADQEHADKIYFQFEDAIINPITEFIEGLNWKNQTWVIDLRLSPPLWFNMGIYWKGSILIKWEILKDENFIKDIEGRLWRTFQQIQRPKFEDRLILAWFSVQDNYNRWFNFLLVEKEGSLYWDWYILYTVNGGFSRSRLPEPIVFGFSSLAEEIWYIRAMHIYDMKPEAFGIKRFSELIEWIIQS